jgi:hypothetical protein
MRLPPAGSGMEQNGFTFCYIEKDGRTIGSEYIVSIAKKGSTCAVKEAPRLQYILQ